jgi:hypothetical protein
LFVIFLETIVFQGAPRASKIRGKQRMLGFRPYFLYVLALRRGMLQRFGPGWGIADPGIVGQILPEKAFERIP